MHMRITVFLLTLCSLAVAQAAPVSDNDVAHLPSDLAQVVRQQFGSDFTIAMKRSSSTVKYLHPQKESWTPFLIADLNNDGVEDAIIVARSKNPLSGQGRYNYKVVDPYFTYHGYGDPKVTATLTSEDPDQGHIVLVIHGSGTEAWRSATPKAKYAIVNLPFENLSVTSSENKKIALNLESREASTGSVVYWDGRKYKWKEQ
jgi:hypothetical protein